MKFQVFYVKIQNFPSVEFQFHPRADLGFSRGGGGGGGGFGFSKNVRFF